MNKEEFDIILELRNDGKRWGEIYERFNLKFKSINTMKKEFLRELRRRSY